MAKDKRIGELPGISAAAVVGLNRVGVVSMHDLLAAEFDRVAYVVDDYNEAARLVKEAKRLCEPGKRSREPQVPSPLSPTPAPSNTRAHHRATTNTMNAPLVATPPAASSPPAATPAPEHHTTSATLAQALASLAQGLSLSGDLADQSRATLARRMAAAAALLAHGGTEPELTACALLEAVESGALPPENIAPRYGQTVDHLLEECTALRAVPMLPTGKPPRYYMDMAKNASRSSRRVCAAHVLAMFNSPGAAPGGNWHARMLLEGLEAAGPDDLVRGAREAASTPVRQAA
jgi:hypothetical protein